MSEGTWLKPELAATVGQWAYVDCHCIVNTGARGIHFTYECAACGNTNLRFIHTLERLKDQRQIDVGVECARARLEPESSEVPRITENEVKRKERWRIFYRKPGRCTADIHDLMIGGNL